MGNITTTLNAIQTALKAPKSQYNKFGKYSYRSCEDILEAVKPFLRDLGAVLVINDEIVQIGERYYVKATATLTAEGESISATAYAREAEEQTGMQASQLTGSTSSYARKYALNGLMCIDDNKDADSTNTNEKPSTAPSKPVNNGMGNLAPKPVVKPQTAPQTTTEPSNAEPAPKKVKSPAVLEDAWNWNGTYGTYAGFTLKELYEGDPKHLNDVYVLAKENNDTNLLTAIRTIASNTATK